MWYGNPRQLLLLGFFGIVIYLSYQILQPFLVSIFLALIFSTLTEPLHKFLLRRFKGRRNLAALGICLGLTIVIFLPLFLMILALSNEANDLYTKLRRPETFEGLRHWLDPQTNIIILRLRRWVTIPDVNIASVQEHLGAITFPVLGAITAFVTGVFAFLVNYAIMLIVLFFMLRDSEHFRSRIRGFSALTAQDERMFVERFRVVTRATVVGSGMTAIAQGAAMGILFAALGLSNVVLWSAIGALLSLIPFVGMALIWVPWAIYLVVTGAIAKAVILILVQTLVIGSLDNVLRPMLMGSGVNMHTLVIFFSILGGIRYFGMLGILFGPLVFALALTCLDLYFRSPAFDPAPESGTLHD